MDDFCDTRNTLGVGAGERFRDWRIHPYFARHSSRCAGTGPFSEAMTIANDLLYNCFYQRFSRDIRDGKQRNMSSKLYRCG